MKKILALTGIAIAALLSSCNKIDTPETPAEAAACDIKVAINVGDFGNGPDTKAMKTGWAAGDKINIWFDDGPKRYPVDGSYDYAPELVLTTTDGGTTWTPSFKPGFDPSVLRSSAGKLYAVYEDTNDLEHTFTSHLAHLGKYYYYGPAPVETNASPIPLILTSSVVYSYDAVNKVLTADIASKWEYMTKIQVTITGLTRDKENYWLTVRNDTGYAGLFTTLGFMLDVMEHKRADSYNAISCNYGTIGGAKTSEGVVFYFYRTSKIDTEADYKFALKEFIGGLWTSATEYTATGKTIDNDRTKLTAITIDGHKFPGLLPAE